MLLISKNFHPDAPAVLTWSMSYKTYKTKFLRIFAYLHTVDRKIRVIYVPSAPTSCEEPRISNVFKKCLEMPTLIVQTLNTPLNMLSKHFYIISNPTQHITHKKECKGRPVYCATLQCCVFRSAINKVKKTDTTPVFCSCSVVHANAFSLACAVVFWYKRANRVVI